MPTFLFRFTIFISLIYILGAGVIQAQQFQDAEFGMIPDSLYTLSQPEESTDAPYMITNKEVDVSFRENNGSISVVLDHHVRIKIFEDSVREASLVSIPYYFDNDMEQVSDIRGWTHLPNGERVALSESEIRTVNLNNRYNIKEFTMPAVEDDAIIEYRYTINRRYIEELPEFFLSHEVPTGAAKMTITYPKYLRYEPQVENYNGRISNDVVLTDTSSVPKIFTIPQPPPVVSERWIAYDIPPTEEESFITTVNDYRAKLKFLMDQFGIPRQTLENSWEVIVAKLRRNINPLKQAERNTYARAKGDSLAQTHKSISPQSLQDSVFQFINRRANFSGNYAPYSNENDSTMLSGVPVDQAAINQTLLAMLRGAGIEADPVLASTRESGKIDRDFPSFYQFNTMMVRSHIGDETYLLDASFPYSQPGLIPMQIYNDHGLVLKEDDFEWIEINPEQSRFDIQVEIEADLSSNGTLSGSVTAIQGGYPVQQIRQQRADGLSDAEIVRQTLFEGYSNLSLDDVQIDNLDDYNNPVEISANFRIEKYAPSFTDGLEFRPMVVGYRTENPFEDENRNLPVTLDAPERLNVSYSISLPSGFEADEERGSQSLSFEGASFEESYNMESDQLRYEFNIDLSDHQFSTDDFSRLYKLYERWVELSNTHWLIEN